MLGKLIKNEWENIWKIPTLLISLLLAVSLIIGLCFSLPVWDIDWIGVPISGIMLFVVYYVAVIAVPMGMLVYLAVRFYRSMFTDEGYLTHTLPVSHHELLLSKIIVLVLWELLSSLAVVLSVFIFGGFFVSFLAGRGIWGDIITGMAELQRSILTEKIFGGWETFGVVMILAVIVSAFGGIMRVIVAICLGQTMGTHRVLGSIACYIGLSTIIGFVEGFFSIFEMLGYSENWENITVFQVYTVQYTMMIIVELALAVGFYFLSAYLIHRQLNLE